MAGKGLNAGSIRDGIYIPFWDRGRRSRNPNGDRMLMLENMYQRILAEMCMGRFKWEGFPDSVSKRFLELTLFRNGLCVLFEDRRTGKLMAVRGSGSGKYDVNDDPTAFSLSGNNFAGITVSRRHAVPVWANAMRVPDWDIVYIMAHRFANLDRTIEINSNNARRTKILAYNENQRLSAQNINKMLDEGESVIPVSSQTDLKALIQSIDLGIEPKSLESLSILRNQEWNRAMGLLGINNANQDKKERLVSDEVDANEDQVATARETNLQARQTAAEQINKMFGLSVTVKYHNMQATMPGTSDMGDGTEGDI